MPRETMTSLPLLRARHSLSRSPSTMPACGTRVPKTRWPIPNRSHVIRNQCANIAVTNVERGRQRFCGPRAARRKSGGPAAILVLPKGNVSVGGRPNTIAVAVRRRSPPPRRPGESADDHRQNRSSTSNPPSSHPSRVSHCYFSIVINIVLSMPGFCWTRKSRAPSLKS